MRPSDISELRLWCLLDGKPGHQNQTLGLADSLKRLSRIPISVQEIQVPTHYPLRLLGPKWPVKPESQKPHLIIGAGHATHLPMLSAKYRFGGRAVVLMKPSLPMQLFDLCVVPDSHSIRTSHSNVVLTRGVLNRITPSENRSTDKALILLGGPSQHFHWSNTEILTQLMQLVSVNRHLRWTLATSRRTPKDFVDSCIAEGLPVEVVQHLDVDRQWLPQQIESSEYIWVTEDSVSMTYEAVTSGATVGTLQLQRQRQTRVTINMDRLIESGCVTPWAEWKRTGQLRLPSSRLFEADRIARELLGRFAPEVLCDPCPQWVTAS